MLLLQPAVSPYQKTSGSKAASWEVHGPESATLLQCTAAVQPEFSDGLKCCWPHAPHQCSDDLWVPLQQLIVDGDAAGHT